VATLVLIPFYINADFVGLSEQLYEDGFCNVTGIDCSSVVIQQMSERHSNRVEMDCMILIVCGLMLQL